MTRVRCGTGFVALVVLFGLAACSSSKPSSAPATRKRATTTEGTETTSTTSAPVTTTTIAGATNTTAQPSGTTTSIPTSPPQRCADGSSPADYDAQNGFYATAIKTVDGNAGTLRYDVVQWLVGDKAKAAWLHDHPTEPDGPPDDYYVINVNPAIYQASFAPDARFFDIANEGDPSSMQSDTRAGFVARIQSHYGTTGTYEGNLFWVRLGGGQITELCEQWVP